MLHGEFANEQAHKLAERVKAAAGDSPRAQVAEAIRIALQRSANEDEIADGVKLMDRLVSVRRQAPADALKYWCLAVLNLNEFMYLD
jgi:hypothetical protein